MLAWLGTSCGVRRDSETSTAQQSRDTTPAPPADARPVLLCFGTSLTAGMGLDPEEAFPALLQRKIDSAGLAFRVVNAGVSGETAAAGLRRIDWLLQQPIAVLLLELGANDALRGQDLAAAKRNLQEIIDRTRTRYPGVHVVVAGMEAPPNLGRRYTREFRDLFIDLARANRAVLIPFLLEGVAGQADLNQADGIHPTAAGARVVADRVWKFLEPVLRAAGSSGSGDEPVMSDTVESS